MTHEVLIKERATGNFVTAVLEEDLGGEELSDAEASWRPVREAAVQRLQGAGLSPVEIAARLQHAHWDWIAKVPRLYLLASKCIGIRYEENWQGLAMLEAGTRAASLGADRGKPIVYVDYLESAPWNLAGFVDSPRYGLIGFRLIEFAVRFSINEGFHGRVGLLSLPQAEEFYEEKCGMVRVPNAGQHGMAWFEFSRKRAAEFLERG
jgi:hypothetical protein